MKRRSTAHAATNDLSVGGVLCGVLWIIVAFWVWYFIMLPVAGNPFDELALIRGALITDGRLVEANEFESEDGRGGVYLCERGVYSYRVPDGRDFTVTKEARLGQLNDREEIEYLPDDPAVSRIKGKGEQTIVAWVVRWMIGIPLLLAMFVGPGVYIVKLSLPNGVGSEEGENKGDAAAL